MHGKQITLTRILQLLAIGLKSVHLGSGLYSKRYSDFLVLTHLMMESDLVVLFLMFVAAFRLYLRYV